MKGVLTYLGTQTACGLIVGFICGINDVPLMPLLIICCAASTVIFLTARKFLR